MPTHVPSKARVRSTMALGWKRLVAIIGLGFIVSCGGSGGAGCGGVGFNKIPGGYPVGKRLESAVSVRVTKGLLDFIAANGANLAAQLIPPDGFAIPATCTTFAGINICICNGQNCKLQTEFASLQFTPKPVDSVMQATIRAKIRTMPSFRLNINGDNCNLSLDSTRSGNPSIGLVLPLKAAVNADTKLTSLDFQTANIDILDLEKGDISIGPIDIGHPWCVASDALLTVLFGLIKDQLKQQLSGPLTDVFCQKCTTRDDCSSLANQGCSADKQFCMRNNQCMQHLGIEGQIELNSLLGGIPGGSKASGMQLYMVAGSYADVEPDPISGLSLGVVGGSTPVVASTCAPPRPTPARPMPLGKTPPYAGNTTPSGLPYHAGGGISTLELDTLGHAFYTAGGLCLEVGSEQVAQLSSALLSALVPSLGNLTHGENAALQIAIRPQYPPTFSLGLGTFKFDSMGRKAIDDPLLRLSVKDLALDFYVYMDERMVRFMRHTVDIDVPLGLDIDGTGQIIPILGDLSQALGNVRVTNSSLLSESPEELKSLLPSLLPAVLGSVSSLLTPIALPELLGMQLMPVQFTSTPDNSGKLSYLGLFFALQTKPMLASLLGQNGQPVASPMAQPRVETYADLVALNVPTRTALLAGEKAQAIIKLDGQAQSGAGPGGLEWQYRVDSGLWRPFDDKRQVTVDDDSLRLPGNHVIEVRARVAGAPYTLDSTPARVEFMVAPEVDDASAALAPANSTSRSAAFGAASNSADVPRGGCMLSQTQKGETGGLLLFVGLFGLLGLLRRRPARYTLLAGGIWALCGLSFSGCAKNEVVGVDGGGGKDGGSKVDQKMDPGKPHLELNPADEIGRYQSAVRVGNDIYISAYDSTTGDLAFASVDFDKATTSTLTWLPLDGLPSGDPTDTSSGAYRGGYEDPGDDIGRFTAMAVRSDGIPIVAYQDVTNGLVKLAARSTTPKPGEMGWETAMLSSFSEGRISGEYTTLALDADNVPTIAYMVKGVRNASGGMSARLSTATAMSQDPTGSAGFRTMVVEESATSCAGLCAEREACVYSDPNNKDKTATVCKPIDSSCRPSCKLGSACQAGVCVEALVPPVNSEPEGTGLYARLVRAGDTMYLLFHDKKNGLLKVASGANWQVSVLAGGNGAASAGKGIGAAASADGTLHVVYGDANHQVYYRTLKAGTLGSVELVDDGSRQVEGLSESHWVGGGLYLFLDGSQPVVAYQDQTAGSLEVARRGAAGWMHTTLGAGGKKTRGYYPQAVMKDGKWLVLDVVYDRAATALSFTAISSLPTP